MRAKPALMLSGSLAATAGRGVEIAGLAAVDALQAVFLRRAGEQFVEPGIDPRRRAHHDLGVFQDFGVL